MVICPTCEGTGFSYRHVDPDNGRKIFNESASCGFCLGRGRCTEDFAKRVCRTCNGCGGWYRTSDDGDKTYFGDPWHRCSTCDGYGLADEAWRTCGACSGKGTQSERRHVRANPDTDAKWEVLTTPCPPCRGGWANLWAEAAGALGEAVSGTGAPAELSRVSHGIRAPGAGFCATPQLLCRGALLCKARGTSPRIRFPAIGPVVKWPTRSCDGVQTSPAVA